MTGRAVIGVIGNAHLVDNRFAVQHVGERNLRAVAEVAGALPLMFGGSSEFAQIEDLLEVVDGILLTGGRANVHPTYFKTAPIRATSPTTSRATSWRWRSCVPASSAVCRCSGSAAAFRR